MKTKPQKTQKKGTSHKHQAPGAGSKQAPDRKAAHQRRPETETLGNARMQRARATQPTQQPERHADAKPQQEQRTAATRQQEQCKFVLESHHVNAIHQFWYKRFRRYPPILVQAISERPAIRNSMTVETGCQHARKSTTC